MPTSGVGLGSMQRALLRLVAAHRGITLDQAAAASALAPSYIEATVVAGGWVQLTADGLLLLTDHGTRTVAAFAGVS